MDFSVEKIVNSNSGHLASRLTEAKLGQACEGVLDIKEHEEIGDGNLNIVHRVTLQTDASIILKYAPPFMKILGPSFPLTQARLEVEYNALLTCNGLCPGSVPVPLLFDKKQNTVIMEDLRGWSLLRSELIQGTVDTEAIKHLMVSIATVHNLSSEANCGTKEHARLCQVFSNTDMVTVTEQYIFVKPFVANDPTNKHDPLLNNAVEALRHDSKCHKRAEEMRKMFVENKDCFCHGDLHTGSVMIRNGESKMFDIEFALMGPSTFDLGIFIANLLFVYIRHQQLNNSKTAILVREAIGIAVESYTSVYNISNMTSFITSVSGFIGCELIRRVIGAAHVTDLFLMAEGELTALILGKAFLVANPDNLQQTVNLNCIINNIVDDGQ